MSHGSKRIKNIFLKRLWINDNAIGHARTNKDCFVCLEVVCVLEVNYMAPDSRM